ncbi:MAG: alpha/beta fold hydrolase [Chloroflexota bacterium]
MEPTLDAAAGREATFLPDGYVVLSDADVRIHFLDWGGTGRPGIVLVHGLSQTAWTWTPVARRLRASRAVVAMDLRGHGLSDAPHDGYELATLGSDAVAVGEGSGVLAQPDDRVVVAGHGFGAIVAAAAAASLGSRCAGLVLVDGGLGSPRSDGDPDVDEVLRSLDEPPEVLRSMDAFLADRRGFDPASWDADQERAARATVVETHAGRVVPATRPHALEACVRAMVRYEATAVLPRIEAPITAVVAGPTDALDHAVDPGLGAIRVVALAVPGHNLMRYRPDAVAAAILAADAVSTAV